MNLNDIFIKYLMGKHENDSKWQRFRKKKEREELFDFIQEKAKMIKDVFWYQETDAKGNLTIDQKQRTELGEAADRIHHFFLFREYDR